LLLASGQERSASPTDESIALFDLFDGASLTGWTGDARFWSVEDGELVGRSSEAVPCKRTTWLVWQGEPLEHFEFSCEVQLRGGNSGVQFRSTHLAEWQVHGPQADLDADGQWTGAIYEQGGRGVLVPRGQGLAFGPAGSKTLDVLGARDGLLADATAREWNKVSIRCLGTTSEVRWNDVLTARLVDGGPGAWVGDGVVALQMHAGPPMEVRFRNLRAKRLAPPTTLATPTNDDEARAEGAPGAAADAAQVASQPQWIWPAGSSDKVEEVTLQRTVTPRAPLARATLWGTCDNGVEVFAGAVRLAQNDDWARAFQRDVTAELPTGDFELRARCWNAGGPAALVLRLTLEYTDGSTDILVTDTDWRTGDGREVRSLGPFGVAPWGTPAVTNDGRARGVLAPEALELPPGFEASLVYEVPRAEGSWVAVTIDVEGRIYCADERGKGLFRVTEVAGAPPLVEALELGLPAAQGLYARPLPNGGLDLYVMLNQYGQAQTNGLWRARDADGDGRFDAPVMLVPLPGNAGEHGPHAIVPAPDGSGLYLIAGNHVPLPAEIEVYHTPPIWQEDQLLPSLPDPNGHAVGIPVPGGWLLKTDFDGGHRELVAVGMRNAYDLALDREGNALTYDSDMEWDMGAPWYRAPRILQLVPGADFGWRNGSGKVPAWAEDTMGSVVDTGPASPTGVLHTRELDFHAPWDDVLLAADWAYGTVHAVTLSHEPGGRTLTGTMQPFLSGRPFPVTDMAAHPDGSLIVTIGGRGARSGVYRVRSIVETREKRVAAVDSVPDPVASSLADAAWSDPLAHVASSDRARRTIARARLLPLDRDSELERVTNGLERMAALGLPDAAPQQEWARQDRAMLLVDALRQRSPLDSSPPRNDTTRIMDLCQALKFVSDDTDGQLTLLRAAELTLVRGGLPEGDARQELLNALEALYPFGEQRVDRSLATLLVALGSEAFTPRAVAGLATAPTQEEALHLAYVLRVHTAGWTPALIDTYLTFLYVDATRFHGGNSLAKYVAKIRDEATLALGAGWTPPEVAAATALPPPIAGNTFVKDWDVADLLPRTGELTSRDLARGARVYTAARCAECHRFDGGGGSSGPDLTGAGARYSAEDLLRAILEPSRDLTDQYQDTEVWLQDGAVHLGRIVEEDERWLTLMPPPPREAERIDIARSEVKLRRPHPTSRMPRGLVNGARRDEVLDLLAYLIEGRATPPKSDER